MRFSDLVGQMISVLIPILHEREFQRVTLHGVEYGGLWIESEKLNQLILDGMGMTASKTPLVFFPYHQIKFVIAASEKIALSKKSFDV